MLKCGHKTMIFLSGVVWMVIGIFLLTLGIHFLLDSLRLPYTDADNRFSILHFLSGYISDRANAVTAVVTIALFLGYFKGKFMLAKAVGRQIKRISGLTNPSHIRLLYGKSYYLLIALMILLGFSLRFLPITMDTRGFIDVAIGSALVNGAMLFFRKLSKYSVLEKK